MESLLVKFNKHQSIVSFWISYQIRKKSPLLPSYHHPIVLFGPQQSFVTTVYIRRLAGEKDKSRAKLAEAIVAIVLSSDWCKRKSWSNRST
jgi:hypothetical protein